jgi:hypothetical protein
MVDIVAAFRKEFDGDCCWRWFVCLLRRLDGLAVTCRSGGLACLPVCPSVRLPGQSLTLAQWRSCQLATISSGLERCRVEITSADGQQLVSTISLPGWSSTPASKAQVPARSPPSAPAHTHAHTHARTHSPAISTPTYYPTSAQLRRPDHTTLPEVYYTRSRLSAVGCFAVALPLAGLVC